MIRTPDNSDALTRYANDNWTGCISCEMETHPGVDLHYFIPEIFSSSLG